MSATPRRSGYIPWLFVAAFAVVIAVNGIMIWFAIGSFSGLYTQGAREQGLHYNAVVAEQKARDALGWNVDASWNDRAHRLEVALRHADGSALSGASVDVALVRPAEKREPFAVAMRETADGRYAGEVALPARGNWDLEIEVAADGHRFGFTRRMFLK
jgi:nitrogen fixation protein FixH